MKKGSVKENKLQSTSIFVDPRQLDLFDRVASKQDKTRSEVMREALNTGYQALKRQCKVN